MKKKINTFIVQNKMKTILSVFGFIALGLLVLSNTNGPARNGNLVTGAPFNGKKTCTKCHSGGRLGAAIKLQLLDSATLTPVSAYSPGGKYKFRITLTDTTSKVTKFGFQVAAAAVNGSTNINTWGKVPTNTHNILKSGRNYVEQSTPLSSGVITIPWNGPAKGTGSVKFYTAGNVVNNNGGTSGDQPKNDSLLITEGPAPAFAVNTQTPGDVKPVYTLTTFSHAGERALLFGNGAAMQKAQIIFSDIQGNIIYTNSTVMNEGDNLVPIPNNNKVKGLVIITVVTADGARTSMKLGLNQ